MAVKAMIFIDGSWLFHNLSHLREILQDPNYIIDYKKLPKLIARTLGEYLDDKVDIVRTNFFGAIPINKPGFDTTPQQNFFNFLEKECHYQMEIHDIDFKHNPDIHPQEKCVDVALATSMMMYAMLSSSYDVAVLVAGDLDYMPLLKKVRALGKRTMLVAMRAFSDYAPTNEKLINNFSLFDFNVLSLEDHLEELRLVREKKLRACESCGDEKFTYWEGIHFYCPECQERYQEKNTDKNRLVLRTCIACNKEQDTFWKGDVFYCNDCREKYRTGKL